MSETIQTKRCSKCKQILKVCNFSKHKNTKDGYQNYCKTCMSAYQKVPINLEKHRKSDAIYRNSTHGRKKRQQYLDSPEGRVATERYRVSEKGRQGNRNRCKKHNQKYHNRYKARMKVRSMFQIGKMPRAKELSCVICRQQAAEYHHYQGYDKQNQLDVIPVCKSCHYELN